MNFVSQSEFGRLMGVSATAVTKWKAAGRITMRGDQVDVDVSRDRLLTYSKSGSKALTGAKRLSKRSPEPLTKPVPSVSVEEAAEYADGSRHGNPKNLPDVVIRASVQIYGGGYDLAELLVQRGMPIAEVRTIVDTWIRRQLDSSVGGRPGLPVPLCDDCWPLPPRGFSQWAHHPLFSRQSLEDDEWEEIVAEAATGGSP